MKKKVESYENNFGLGSTNTGNFKEDFYKVFPQGI